MAHHVETDITVQRFGYSGDPQGKRLIFPRAELRETEGRSGAVGYGARDLIFDGLEGRLDTLRWTADAASLGAAWLRDDAGRIDMQVQRIEMSRGLMLTRADRGVEIVAPHVSLSEMKLTVKGPFGRKEPIPPPPPSPPPTPRAATQPSIPVPALPEEHALRQTKLRFLDSLSGRIYLTVKVVLDLPVIGKRTLDQQLRVPVQEGSLDFRALEDSLDWLEGTFLDIKHDEDKLSVAFKVPVFGSSRDLVSWTLDDEAQTLASFGRVPVRSLSDFRMRGKSKDNGESKKGGGVLKALSLDAIDVALSLLAPRSVEAAGGVIMFGGDDQPGMVDLKVSGAINDQRPGRLSGAIGSIDTTIKDVRLGPALLTADRLHFDGLDELVVEFDGFHPKCVNVVIHRVTATNLMLQLAGKQS
ncbi:MAG TPA: hypothetical protein VFQ53_43415 [Kofleriaceae bacterium]|nr:hypothetical protein [Kofleriaceae bacterium]